MYLLNFNKCISILNKFNTFHTKTDLKSIMKHIDKLLYYYLVIRSQLIYRAIRHRIFR